MRQRTEVPLNIDLTIWNTTIMLQIKTLFCCTTIPNQVHPVHPFKMNKRGKGKEPKENMEQFLDVEGKEVKKCTVVLLRKEV